MAEGDKRIGAAVERLTADLQALGVATGDLVFVHSSLKSLGPVAGGAATVVAALERALGAHGLLLMPSFNLVQPMARRAAIWDHASTPSTVGWITEHFRQMPGTVRSDHYSHSVAARGSGAAELVAGHRSPRGPRSPWDRQPWGATYGVDSPMHRAYTRGAKLLMLGTNYHTATYLHLAETLATEARRRSDPDVRFVGIDREAVGRFWDRHGTVARGTVAAARCRLLPARELVDVVVAELERHPEWSRRKPG